MGLIDNLKNDNPLKRRYKERYEKLPEEVQKKLDELDTWDWREHQLLVLKKSRVMPRTGDIFVFSPKENIFFFGKVLEGNIDHITQDSFIHGKSVVFLFREKSKVKEMDDFTADYTKLLRGPIIIDASYWRKGYFETIGHEKISKEEMELDYGFYSVVKAEFMATNGTPIYREPAIYDVYGIVTIIAVAMSLAKEAIIDPSLLQ